MAGFVGRYEHSLDTKGRVIVPAKFRTDFERGGYLAQHIGGCLALWTPAEFDRQMAVMSARAESGKANRNRARLWASSSYEVEIDRQRRMAIPAPTGLQSGYPSVSGPATRGWSPRSRRARLPANS